MPAAQLLLLRIVCLTAGAADAALLVSMLFPPSTAGSFLAATLHT